MNTADRGCVYLIRRCIYNENDISAEEASESKGSRLQSKNGNKVGKKGSRSKTCQGQKDPYYFG